MDAIPVYILMSERDGASFVVFEHDCAAMQMLDPADCDFDGDGVYDSSNNVIDLAPGDVGYSPLWSVWGGIRPGSVLSLLDAGVPGGTR